ncbi:MAG: hypothetical protein IT287_08965, partial [Bdellovibrionaceae bacterium]|nr:hypothetical protein [Pseudobdellovibrionaceae bacterium]
LRSRLLHFFWSRNLVQFFRIDWPLFLSDTHYDFVARQLKALEIEYKKNTNTENPFIVVFYPEQTQETEIPRLKSALNKHQVHFIDYSEFDMGKRLTEKSRVDFDGHPTSAAYKHLAELLLNDLKKFFE